MFSVAKLLALLVFGRMHKMTQVLVTVDTELSALLHQRGVSADSNVSSSIQGTCDAGEFGIGWQMDALEARGLKAVFFVDPLPALIYGDGWLQHCIGAILARGHEVQLHIHTEWLAWADPAPVGGRQGQNLADFSFADQCILLKLASDLLVGAGAPKPTAFRAGNYGANDDSLRALATLDIGWDSSVNAPYLGGACKIGLPPEQVSAAARHAVIELPVAGLSEPTGRIRPAQICALSAREMREALRHAAANAHPAFVIVTHSFEMLSRDRQRPNRAVMARFEAMCDVIAAHPQLSTSGFAALEPAAVLGGNDKPVSRLAPNRLRTWSRLAEQALATWRYERQLRPV